MKNLRDELGKKSKEWLIDRLMELTVVSSENEDRINLSLIAHDERGAGRVAKFKSQLNKAALKVKDHKPLNWDNPAPTKGFDAVADTLAVMVPNNLQDVMEISEYAWVKLDSVFELQDEDELGYLVDAFRSLHLTACYKLKPDPSLMAKRLAALHNKTEWGFFEGPPDGYFDVLGIEGLKQFMAATGRKR